MNCPSFKVWRRSTRLLDHARLMTASQLEKLSHKYALVQRHGQDPHPLGDAQRRYVRHRDTEDGMVKIEAVLHPEEAELVWTMINHAATQLTREPAPSAIGDSAEAGAAGQAPEVAVTSPLSAPSDAADGRSGDSAESWAAAQAPRVAVTSPFSDAADGRSDDSAESWAAAQGPRDAVIPPPSAPSDAVDGRVDDSAESLNETEPTSGRGQSVLHQRADAAKRGFNRADALVSLAQGYLRGDQPQRSPIEVTVTILQSGLRADMTDPTEVGEMGESFVSAEAARRLSCDAGVIEVVEGEHGTPLSVGRKRRTIAGALKCALHKRDRMCTFPGCTHRIFLEGHHIKHWADGGETSLNNLALLCSLCRARHKLHYAEYRVMPGSWGLSSMKHEADAA